MADRCPANIRDYIYSVSAVAIVLSFSPFTKVDHVAIAALLVLPLPFVFKHPGNSLRTKVIYVVIIFYVLTAGVLV